MAKRMTQNGWEVGIPIPTGELAHESWGTDLYDWRLAMPAGREQALAKKGLTALTAPDRRRPAPCASDEAAEHAAAQWHHCVFCSYTYLCHSRHAHDHPGCRGEE